MPKKGIVASIHYSVLLTSHLDPLKSSTLATLSIIMHDRSLLLLSVVVLLGDIGIPDLPDDMDQAHGQQKEGPAGR